MLLRQQRRLTLARRVFGRGAALGTTFGSVAYNTNERAITVEQLLNHTSGFENNPNDPMFQELNRNHASLIGWVLDNRNPATTPGTNYTYLNFGYCLLGRIIERITRRTYVNHVQTALLTPAGVTSMQIAGDTLAQRAANEVVYFGQSNENPYSMRVARMDAHGGWIATAMDLLRFLRVVDGFRPPADVLTAASITRMTTGSTANANYALGWAVDGAGNWDHNGALPGTLSMLRRRSNQLGQAALVNTRRPNTATSNAQDVMLQALYQVVDDITAQLGTLPAFDLFP
jgi:CubicO group peptidase (beta-lactamase class C family)